MVEAMEIPKGFKKTEVGIIPSDWDVIMLKKLLSEKLQNGVFFKPSSKGIGIKLINVGDLYKGFPINVDELELFDASVDEEKRYKVLDGDLFFTRSSVVPAGIAHCNIYANDMAEKVVFDSHVIKARPNKKIVSPFYLFRYCSYAARNYLVSHAKTAIMTTIDQGVIENCPIVLPPTKAEQTAIAEALNDADALIAELEKLIAKKKAIKQGAMQELLKPKEGWEVEKLPELVWYQEGPGVRKSQFRTSGVKLLNGTNIERGELLLDKTDRFISNHEAYGWYSHFLVDDGDILIACSGISVDKFDEKVTEASSIHLPLCMNTSTMRFKVISTRITKPFFFHFLKSYSFKQQIGEQITGSAQLNFGPAHVKWVDINFPSPSEQNEIAQILSDMDAETEVLEKKLNKYKMLKQGMMQNLLTGRIRLI